MRTHGCGCVTTLDPTWGVTRAVSKCDHHVRYLVDHPSGGLAYYESLGNVSCCERDGEFRGYARQNIVARALLNQEAQRAAGPVPRAQTS